MDAIIPVTFDSALVSKTDNAIHNLETLLHILQEYGIRDELIFSGEMICSSMSRPGLERPDGPHTASRHHRRPTVPESDFLPGPNRAKVKSCASCAPRPEPCSKPATLNQRRLTLANPRAPAGRQHGVNRTTTSLHTS